jgi:hypothetical protein
MTASALLISTLVDLLGLIGAVLVSVPFLREHRLRRLVHWFERGGLIPGLEDASTASRQTMLDELGRFKPGDGAYVGWGLLLIAMSYAVHIVAVLMTYLSA